jgi:hypothetical protein
VRREVGRVGEHEQRWKLTWLSRLLPTITTARPGRVPNCLRDRMGSVMLLGSRDVLGRVLEDIVALDPSLCQQNFGVLLSVDNVSLRAAEQSRQDVERSAAGEKTSCSGAGRRRMKSIQCKILRRCGCY